MRKWTVVSLKTLLIFSSLFAFNQKAFSRLSFAEVDEKNNSLYKLDRVKKSDIHLCENPDFYIENMTIDEWTSTPVKSDQLLMILRKFNQTMADWLKTENLWIEQECPKEKIDHAFDAKKDIESFSFTYLGKWIVPKDVEILTVGDQHGVFSTTASILDNLRNNQFIDDEMKLRDDIRLVFLGDYSDRGDEGIRVFATAVLLALKNNSQDHPGKVILLRGNHEHIERNLTDLNFGRELMKMDPDFEKTNMFETSKIYDEITGEIKNAYEYLPCGMWIGFKDELIPKLKLFSHAGLEIRFDYRPIFNYKTEELALCGGTCLQEITRDSLLDWNTFQSFMKKFVENQFFDKHLKKYFYTVPPYYGFLWNDINLGPSSEDVSLSKRGKGIFSFSYNLIRSFFELMETSSNAKLAGVVRGHQHVLPKEVCDANHYKDVQNKINIENRSIGQRLWEQLFYKNSPRHLIESEAIDWEEITPSCCIMTENNEVLVGSKPIICNDFSITTLISGPIYLGHDSWVNYSPTFIGLKYNDNGDWTYKSY